MDDNFTTAQSIVEEAIGEDEMHTSNPKEESSRFVEKSTISAQELTTFSNPEYGNVTIARCVADYVYPIPNQITFTTVGGGKNLRNEIKIITGVFNLWQLKFFQTLRLDVQ